jgi:hypothetical protein
MKLSKCKTGHFGDIFTKSAAETAKKSTLSVASYFSGNVFILEIRIR